MANHEQQDVLRDNCSWKRSEALWCTSQGEHMVGLATPVLLTPHCLTLAITQCYGNNCNVWNFHVHRYSSLSPSANCWSTQHVSAAGIHVMFVCFLKATDRPWLAQEGWARWVFSLIQQQCSYVLLAQLDFLIWKEVFKSSPLLTNPLAYYNAFC